MRDEFGGKIMKKIVGLRAKTYSYLTDDNNESKIATGTKIYVIKRKHRFEDYKKCLEANKCLEKNKIDVKSLIKNPKEFIMNNKII